MIKHITNRTVPNKIRAFGLTVAISLAAFTGQSALLMNETFNNGTPGGTPGDTSDGNGFWFGQMGVYGGTVENPNYYMAFGAMSFSVCDYPKGSSTGVNNITNYSVNIGTLKLGGDFTSGAVSYVLICTRKINATLGFGYEFRPDAVDGNNKPTAWKVSYQPAQGATPIKIGTFPGESPTLSNVEIRVRGGTMRLYIDGVPLDVIYRPTHGTPGQGATWGEPYNDYQRALEIICNTAEGNVIEATVDDVTITTPEPQAPFQDSVAGTLLTYDGFDYTESSFLHDITAGGFGWAGNYTKGEQYGNTAAFIANPVYGANNAPLVLAPGASQAPLHTLGNQVSTADYRTMRYLDVDSLPAELKEGDGTVLRKTGEAVWLSAMMHQASDAPGFFGLSLFSNSTEVVFLGKAGGTAADRIVWRVEGKFPNTTGLTTKSPRDESLMLLKIEWNHDGSTFEHYITNTTTQVITTNHIPVNPDKMYLWVNPNVDHPSATLDTTTADGVSIRNSVATPTAANPNNPYLGFNRIGVRGQNTSDGRIDEVRIGTTFRSVLPSDRSELDVHVSKDAQNNTVVRWKTKAGFVLKSADSLPALSWETVIGTPQQDGLDSVLTIPSSSPQKFYRLASQ